MTKKEQLANVVAALDERETELVLRLFTNYEMKT